MSGVVPPPGTPQSENPPGADFIEGDWICSVAASDDGEAWTEVGRAHGAISPPQKPPAEIPFPGFPARFARRGTNLDPAVHLNESGRKRFYRITLESTGGGQWVLSEVDFFKQDQPVEVAGPQHFTSAWMPEGIGSEWVYVDLGTPCDFDRIMLYWIRRAAEDVIQVSDDAAQWTDLIELPKGTALIDNLSLDKPARARYVRLLLNQPAARNDGRQELSGGALRLQRASQLTAGGERLSLTGFNDADWIVATVQATVLSSYYNIGALPDPNYGNNQLMISDAFFCADFWYRMEFMLPPVVPGRLVWLNLDGINWKADVFLNGRKLGRIEGAFMRGRFDISEHIRRGELNALAVRIEANGMPGSTKQKTRETAGLNGGALGADNPTYHASVGWDWIPPVRGHNIGIWNDVYLTQSGSATIENPYVKTTLLSLIRRVPASQWRFRCITTTRHR